MSNLGALTTTFTPPSSCPTGISSIGNYIFQGARDTDACLPSGYSASVGDYYSPGVACPSAYTAACSNVASIADATETAYTCCPTWLSYGCQSTTDFEYPWQSTLGCTIISDSNYPFTTSVEVVDGTATYQSSRTFSGHGGINAFSVAIRFQQSDLAATSSKPTAAVPVSSSSSTFPLATTNTSSSSSPSAATSSNTNNGLSTGAAAGLGVAIGFVGMSIIGVGFYLLRRAKKRSAVVQSHDFECNKPELGSGNELDPVEAPSSGAPGGTHGSPQVLQELRAEEVAKEIDGCTHPAELSAAHPAELP